MKKNLKKIGPALRFISPFDGYFIDSDKLKIEEVWAIRDLY